MEKNIIVFLLTGCLIVGRFLIKYVDGCGSNLSVSKSISEILLIYETASCSINDPYASLALVKLFL
jgi:hypothetical protein